ncbi:MAG: tetrathionate reductase family octaheme c-type cytochrome [Anaerolineae bacterium]|jgi:octaheme c-type cytochrome (tetrathionate reductase family)|nr:tetrathionate reductase family octaheme c-type cytochrome [Anaerolineae bacterium]MBT7189532.1 tetrathionate reductase family octaheme c-type cytochrome [Anaerolineae bacterium]MBT7990023.1 tetrathionate reductase family octaheme c-type cytochrome [Anaerolineae bacterium]
MKRRKPKLATLVSLTGIIILLISAFFARNAQAADPISGLSQGEGEPDSPTSTADHSKFEILQQDFATGPDVTAACLTCHTEAAKQIMETPHWTWEYTDPQTGEALGKKNVINNFCQSIESNEPRCTSCHIGYGWEDKTFDFSAEESVDCLVCHDTTGTYKKLPTGAGHPVYNEPKEFPAGSGKYWDPVDLTLVAQNVGATSRQTCGACHFEGGGGNGVKHGDLDQSLVSPDHHLDVHMDIDGLNFTCATCHEPVAHAIPGSRYQLEAKDEDGFAVASKGHTALTCEDCHGLEPHPSDANLDHHVEKIACQTCHIPSYARGGYPTKTWWDWSTAGRLGADGKSITEHDEKGWDTYISKKGDFIWEENVQPEYYWFDGNIDYQNMKPFEAGTEVLQVNQIHGSPDDPGSRIWPFKVMRGKQPYDTVNRTLVTPHVYGADDTSYWKNFDWEKAIATGMEYSSHDYSGEYGFIETEMYWPISHMVAPAEDALHCDSCHRREQGILADVEGVYIPGITTTPLLDQISWTAIMLTFVGVVIHGSARFISSKNRNKKEGI